jgi:hypothetical protein
MPARPGAQNAKTILSIVVGYALDQACQHFLGSWFGIGAHRLSAARFRGALRGIAVTIRMIDRNSIRPDEDWEGNNAAFT